VNIFGSFPNIVTGYKIKFIIGDHNEHYYTEIVFFSIILNEI